MALPGRGVYSRNGSEIASHAISALLDSHPSFVDVALDIRNAFNSVARGAFLPIVVSHFPDLLPWVNSIMYGKPTYLFFGGKPDKPSTPSSPLQVELVRAAP